ncbi:conjugal transfer protein [Streptomyces sp. NPDC048508]|uniref:conjugal transfer protein n=1 Tax=Streptomyces sp. NPDC048508 TaxID=3365561 RepID=UPI003724581E
MPVSKPVTTEGADTAGPAGWAQLYVATYLEAGKGTEITLAPYFPLIRDVSLEAPPRAQRVDRLASVRVVEVSSGYWAVTVAAHVTSTAKPTPKSAVESEASALSTLRYFQVPVHSAKDGGFIATALPAEVAAPSIGTGPETGYGDPVPADEHDAAVSAVDEFLSAYLTGTGELDRYLSPGTDLNAVSPAPYKQVEATQLAEKGGQFVTDAPAAEGDHRELLVDVTATDASGEGRPLTYALALKARDGRWEIAAVEAAPTLATSSKEKQ